jgi:excisionase family DNA binding protein
MDRRKPDRRNRNQDQLLSDNQVAVMAGVPVNTVRKWRQVGTLPFVKVGRHPRVWLSEFQKTFHQPKQNGPWEQIPKGDKMPVAGNIRRKL